MTSSKVWMQFWCFRVHHRGHNREGQQCSCAAQMQQPGTKVGRDLRLCNACPHTLRPSLLLAALEARVQTRNAATASWTRFNAGGERVEGMPYTLLIPATSVGAWLQHGHCSMGVAGRGGNHILGAWCSRVLSAPTARNRCACQLLLSPLTDYKSLLIPGAAGGAHLQGGALLRLHLRGQKAHRGEGGAQRCEPQGMIQQKHA